MPDNELIGPKEYGFQYEVPGAEEFLKRFEGNVEYQKTLAAPKAYFKDGRFYPGTVGTENKKTVGYGHQVQPGEDFSDGLTDPQATDLLRRDADERMKWRRNWYNQIYGEGEWDKRQPASKFVLLDTRFQSNDPFPRMAGHLRAGDTHSAMPESWTRVEEKSKAGGIRRNRARRLEAWPELEREYFDLGVKNPVRKIQVAPARHATHHTTPPMQGPRNIAGSQAFGPQPPAPPAPYGPPAPEAGIRLPRRPLFSD